ncbi:MAG TPA: glycoside hydrolase family 3 N-terminal domain-containing protein [Candidatus Sulfotelmatobacter sp.]|nr:glycoside hydrolase family 3 N-terminal domain-containing protein [Candidatus Sulfotelmatobacter sp.]
MREVGHFAQKSKRLTPSEVAHLINEDQRRAVEQTRLGIPILMNEESLHGACWGDATVFPQSIAMAATWDPELVGKAEGTIGEELRAVGVRQTLAPVLNITRDPRWGRTEETYGEDPWLTAQMGLACVKAIESNGVDCMLKHFVADYGEGGRDSGPVYYSERYLREVDLYPFEVAVRAGKARSVMAAYSSIDGVPCAMNSWLLTDVLRGDWGFDGIVCGDYGAVAGIEERHKLQIPADEVVSDYLKAGLDVDLPSSTNVVAAVMQGDVSPELLDRSVARLLKIKFDLGLFEKPYVDEPAADEMVQTPRHRQLALQAARESIVLLKNQNGFLPLDKETARKLVVIGPANLPLGDYTGTYRGQWKGHSISILDGLAKVAPECQVIHLSQYNDFKDVPSDATAVIVVATIKEGEGVDRTLLTLPALQEQLILNLAARSLPVIVLLCTGAPVTMESWLEKVPAVVQAWYPGQEGGQAVAEVLFGDYNPGGRLPITFPRDVGQVPIYYSTRPSGRYGDNMGKPQFPFGFGLSYTTFKYSNARLSDSTIQPGETLTVSIDVENTGSRAGDEVVQLYTHQSLAYMSTLVKELRGFRRVHLDPGEKQTVGFALGPAELCVWNLQMKRTVEPGKLDIMIGRSSAEIIQTLHARIL